MEHKLKIGLFATGLDTYWSQFDGLLDKLTGYKEEIKNKIESFVEVEIIDGGMVDNVKKANLAASLFTQKEVDIVFLYLSTYCLSSTILPIAQKLNCPLIILNLSPAASMDYNYVNSLEDRGHMTGYWLQWCQACPLPEIANVFNRSGIQFNFITGHLEEDYVWDEIQSWLDATIAYVGMRRNRLGILGNYYGGMIDVYTDLAKQSAVFGTHMEILEISELRSFREDVTEEDVERKISEFDKYFEITRDCDLSELIRAAKTSLAVDRMVSEHNLGTLAYYFEGAKGDDYEDIATSIIAGNTLLTGKNIPVAGEYEIKTAQAMKILSLLGAGGSFAEFYAIDFKDDVTLLGHDGPAHFVIAEGAVKLVPVPVYHGKPGKGLSIQMSVKLGDVTLLSVCEDKKDIFLLVAEGQSVAGDIIQTGNTNSRYRFPLSAREFVNNWSKSGPSHHCAIGVGHIAHKLEKLASLLKIPIIKIC